MDRTDSPSVGRRLAMGLSVVIGLVGLPISGMYWKSAFRIIAGEEVSHAGEAALALGIALTVLGPVLLVGVVVAWVLRPPKWPLWLNLAALAGPFLWLFAATVPAPREKAPPYVAPQPAYACGVAAPFEGDPGERWTVAVKIEFDPPNASGSVIKMNDSVAAPGATAAETGGSTATAGGSMEEVSSFLFSSDQCGDREGRLVCPIPGGPIVDILPSLQDEISIEGMSEFPGSNTVVVTVIVGDAKSHTTNLPYSASCEPEDVNRAWLDLDARFGRELLLRKLYVALFGE